MAYSNCSESFLALLFKLCAYLNAKFDIYFSCSLCSSILSLFYVVVGHGKSDGDRIHIDDFKIYVRDVIQHIELLKAKHPRLPVFIIGESMVSQCMYASTCIYTYV